MLAIALVSIVRYKYMHIKVNKHITPNENRFLVLRGIIPFRKEILEKLSIYVNLKTME